MGIETIQIEQVDQSAPVGPQLIRALRQSIIRNQLEPGTRLSEAEIGAKFGVSRQPVREAFIKLAEEGLLEIRPQRGSFVRKISVGAVLDARFVREAVEADVAKACATYRPAGLVEELRGQIDAQAQLVDHHPAAFVPLDDEFHQTLAKAAGRPNAWAVIVGMKSQMDRVRQMTSAHFPLEHLIAQHTAVVDAIDAGDPEAAEKAMRGHLQMILSDLPAIREAFPDYFDPDAA
ncbi:GntR family transcriptional regulator [Alloyangia pacifica]|uniref:DNA-binding transcriptional regulator, GntR family n=1 Tax=Alloyangia pacifica TaxID=311180 RepID=A0A1I6T2L3_9RHOB|nr:GntR family transcriptional regulator [Alloyangia pacifica]SDG94557.1 DNA-binding transcriptional regulator, GntR family [Alloyangia pacifica]SFS83207.1 DNA-binding transcriptional regulator, GntR family [Alloyangia pacifica]